MMKVGTYRLTLGEREDENTGVREHDALIADESALRSCRRKSKERRDDRDTEHDNEVHTADSGLCDINEGRKELALVG